ncbi:hypothetical protein Aab01nite_06750 [Paractinoplanes abujensis]|uniref:Uncharacterized protein n=1 Tax=Paractinoplanes abujensis TaxID=882441 RepID=A0A7W7CMW0_9ACTN|nr:hypothetical protein [Actinoplanes abujensis]MBB4691499.1 hypothetical protein [Actinoplanes abujensis]GID17085.1 hypothetical protein Aab01nite_06750 [Actinoplanes abujensis]
MGPFLFPVLAFVLWEFPSMVVMSVHKFICARTGGSFEEQFAGVWPYRLIGMFTFWPFLFVTGALAAAVSAQVATAVIALEAVAVITLLIWARTSDSGA